MPMVRSCWRSWLLRCFYHSLDLSYPNLTKSNLTHSSLFYPLRGANVSTLYILALAGANASSHVNPSPCEGGGRILLLLQLQFNQNRGTKRGKHSKQLHTKKVAKSDRYERLSDRYIHFFVTAPKRKLPMRHPSY